jgi:hypothetical protein
MIQFGVILWFNSKWYGKAVVEDDRGKKIVFIHWSALRKMCLKNKEISWALIMEETVPLPKMGDRIVLEVTRDNEHGYYASCWSPIYFYDDVCGQIYHMKG